MTTMTEEGRRLRTNILTGVVGTLLVMLALIVVAIFGDPEAVDGPDGSSFVTTPQGTAALAETIERTGGRVVRHLSPLDGPALDGVDAVVAADVGSATYDPFEIAALAAFVEAGGTVLLAGRPNGDLVSALVGEVPAWSATTTLSGTRTLGDGVVVSGRFGVFEPGNGLPLVVADTRDLAVAYGVGSGVVILVADSAILSNATLDRASNAHFALSLVGEGAVLFDEFRHGFTDQGRTGLIAAAPDGWRNAGLLAALATVVALIVYGRRFGPPEPEGRDFVPSRDRLIIAVGSTLRRTGDHVGATAAVRAEVVRRVRRRALLSPDADDTELRAAASRFLAPEEIEAVFSPAPDTVLAADRALARLGTIDGESP